MSSCRAEDNSGTELYRAAHQLTHLLPWFRGKLGSACLQQGYPSRKSISCKQSFLCSCLCSSGINLRLWWNTCPPHEEVGILLGGPCTHTDTHPPPSALGAPGWGQAPSWPQDRGAERAVAQPPPQACHPFQPSGDDGIWGAINLLSPSGVAQTNTTQDGTLCSYLLSPFTVHGRCLSSESNSIMYLFIIHSRRSLVSWINMHWSKWGCFFKMPLYLFFPCDLCKKACL